MKVRTGYQQTIWPGVFTVLQYSLTYLRMLASVSSLVKIRLPLTMLETNSSELPPTFQVSTSSPAPFLANSDR